MRIAPVRLECQHTTGARFASTSERCYLSVPMRVGPDTVLGRHDALLRVARIPWFFAFVAATTLSIHLLALGHLVFFTHVRCEHGAFVHSAHRDPQVSSRGDPHNSGWVGGGAVCSPTWGDPDEHDHCGLLATITALSVSGPLVERCQAGPPEAAWSIRAARGNAVVPVLRFAPKMSPTV